MGGQLDQTFDARRQMPRPAVQAAPQSGAGGRLEHRDAAPSPGSPGDAEGERDYILELLLSQATAGLTYQECAGVSYRQLHEDPEAAISRADRAMYAAKRAGRNAVRALVGEPRD